MTDQQNFEEEEQDDIFIWPSNFLNTSYIFNGMIESRKLVEAIAVVGVLGFIEYLFLMTSSTLTMVVVMVLTLGPILIAGIVGIGGDSIFEFVSKLFSFMKNKRKLRYRRIVKDAKTSTSRAKSGPSNAKKKSSR